VFPGCVGTSPKTFVRDATGLVRSLGFLDQFLMSQSIVNPVLGFVLTALYAPYFFPGAYLPLVFLIGSIPAFAMAYIYSVFSAGMPRSGGDYVWSSRILGPLFAMIQFIMLLGTTIILGGAFASYAGVSLLASQLFFALGVTMHNAGLLTGASSLNTTSVGYPIDMLLIAICTTILVLGLKGWMWVQRVSFVLYYVVTAVFIGLLVWMGTSQGQTLFDNAMAFAGSSATYSSVISGASSGGFSLSGFNAQSTVLAAIPWGFLTFTGFNYGAYLSGETKSVKSNMTRAMFLSAGISAVLLLVMSLLAYHDFGQSFLNAASYDVSTGASLPAIPTVSLMLSLVSPVTAVLIGISFILVAQLNVMGDILAMSRMFFAASFDRMLPTKFADVSERVHTPVLALLIIAFLWAAWVTTLWFAGFASTFLNAGLVEVFGYGLPFVATGLFYFVKRDLFKATVGAIAKPGPIILASVVAVICFGFYGVAELFPIASGVFLGASITNAVGFLIVMGLIGAGIYGLAVVRARSSGVDLRAIYSEIPPE
jgi:basic amino acid/polyamine antiporter, APA family